MLQALQSADIDWDNIKEQSSSILEDLGELVDSDEAKGLIEKFIDWIQSLIGQ